jgi:hypothetical protein
MRRRTGSRPPRFRRLTSWGLLLADGSHAGAGFADAAGEGAGAAVHTLELTGLFGIGEVAHVVDEMLFVGDGGIELLNLVEVVAVEQAGGLRAYRRARGDVEGEGWSGGAEEDR